MTAVTKTKRGHPPGVLVLLGLLLALAGCGPNDQQGRLFTDDFRDRRSGWGQDQQVSFERGYLTREGVYSFKLYEPDWFAWASPGQSFGDVRIEVDARLVSGARDGHFGLICRRHGERFYYFAISADGYYAIFRSSAGEEGQAELEILTGPGEGMLPSTEIRRGERTNHLVAVCEGDRLSLTINDERVAAVIDGAYERGDVGLGAGSGPGGQASVYFSDFVVSPP